MTSVAFVCVHNSCRSQIAEALAKRFAADVFEAYSGGTHIADRINPDAVRLVSEIYGIDMTKTQTSKPLADLPEIDVLITMGCNVHCPDIACQWREDWGLDDPSGQPDDVFRATIATIEQKVLELRDRLRQPASG